MRLGTSSTRAPAVLLCLGAALCAAPVLGVACGSGGSGVAAASGTGGSGGSGKAASSAASSGKAAGSSATASSGGTGGSGGMATAGSGGAAATTSTGGGGGSGDAGAPVTVTLSPGEPPLPGESACTVVEVTSIPEPDFNHLNPCTPITYATNPPSGGNHWPIWAAYKIYTDVVPREMSVHDLEHGAIVLSYKCAGSCPDVVAALTSVFENMTPDPECLTLMGPPARMVLTPDPDLPTPIAAAAWGATYTATCIDTASLSAFATAHYDHGREDLCEDGQDIESMPLCADGG